MLPLSSEAGYRFAVADWNEAHVASATTRARFFVVVFLVVFRNRAVIAHGPRRSRFRQRLQLLERRVRAREFLVLEAQSLDVLAVLDRKSVV